MFDANYLLKTSYGELKTEHGAVQIGRVLKRKNILRYEKLSQRPTPSTSRRTLSSFALDAEVSSDVEVDQSLVAPPMSRRDEAVCLLHAAAEVEHGLMVQYLFAAYSLRIDAGSPEKQATISRW